VAAALLKVRLPEEDTKLEAIRRGCRWVEGMQGSDGGWAAFDRDNNRGLLASIPLADFMTPLDSASPDVTAHALELLRQFKRDAPVFGRALDYLKTTQQADGSWHGRWGVNYIYGTGLVLASLGTVDCSMQQDYIREAVRWLEACQNEDGGWGETCRSYEEPSHRGKGPSTASQTAWALLGLIAAGEVAGSAVARGVNYLVGRQRDDGSWKEEAYTGTGFPRAFYLRYDLYRIYFPLLALARYKGCIGEVTDDRH
jgi:squalene-hopene/tetraprenyl-beta-curcumene cyclase